METATLAELVTILGRNRGTIASWVERGKLSSCGTRPAATKKTGNPAHVYDVAAAREVAARHPNMNSSYQLADVPPGHVTVLEASHRLGLASHTVRRFFDDGLLAGVSVKVGTHTVRLVTTESLDKFLASPHFAQIVSRRNASGARCTKTLGVRMCRTGLEPDARDSKCPITAIAASPSVWTPNEERVLAERRGRFEKRRATCSA